MLSTATMTLNASQGMQPSFVIRNYIEVTELCRVLACNSARVVLDYADSLLVKRVCKT